ncbi:MAG: hypothetical protein WBM87_03900 [Woeseiaceae bacterium]
MHITESVRSLSIRKEALLLLILFVGGIVLMPAVIYLIGQMIFGSYGGDGFGGFFGAIGAKLLSADGVAWLLVASPYLIVQCLRITAYAWRRSSKTG